ncbi:MAG: hypothetical protein B6D61_04230 [Bacteroidetes bacterium 4484_249]|nr:MAG: hypothetical protein B6D61_04230 [Bacteroidetes bacterium 4484_249]
MKKLTHNKRLYPMIGLFILSFIFFAGNNYLHAKNLGAFLSYSTFNSPETGPYIETYLTVAGNTVQFVKNDNNKFQAAIQVIMIFKNGEDVVNYDKYELMSPELDDTTSIDFNFIDQQRYSLSNGNYEFEIQIWDSNREAKPFISLQPLTIDFPEDKISISGIQLVESYSKTEEPGVLSKNGYDLIPYISNYFPERINKIIYYSEIYNSDKILGENQKYLLTCYLRSMDKSKPLSKYISYKKTISAEVNIAFHEFDIANLKSGNYFLVIEARDQQNNLLGMNRIFIQRSNPSIKLNLDDISYTDVENSFASKINSLDTLKEYIYYLEPIATDQEIYFVSAHLNTSDIETLQKFFYKFWLDRNELEPEREWNNYLKQVNKVNVAYSTSISKGYESDRGRVYLKYGPPNAISEDYNEPATYPYEIWHYYELANGQRNRKFVFYTRDIVTNEFALLHSDVTGEISNYRWQYVLYGRTNTWESVDDSKIQDTWGGNSKKYFDLPR